MFKQLLVALALRPQLELQGLRAFPEPAPLVLVPGQPQGLDQQEALPVQPVLPVLMAKLVPMDRSLVRLDQPGLGLYLGPYFFLFYINNNYPTVTSS